MSDYVTLAQLVEEFPFTERTWRHWRETGTGPKGSRVGRRVIYRRSDVEEWLHTQFEAAK